MSMQTIVGAAEMKSTADDEPASSCRLKVLTWNVNSDEVDGGTPLRLKAIISEIKTSVADVIFLQEVSLNFKTMLQQQFGHAYDFEDCSSHAKEPFFVMIMLRRCRMTVLSSKRIDFQGGGQSNMGRHILLVETQLAGWNTNIILMTAHLESCKENSEIRVLQYEQLLRLIVQAPAACVQICGGDFNLREAEDKKARKRLKDAGIDVGLVVDTYDAAGRPFEASCTWRRKMDKTADARSIQARFDRQMFRSGSADFKLAAEDGVTLLGLQDVAGIDGETACRAGFSTPSDHFGIFCEYILGDELQTVSKSATSGGLRSAVDRSASLESPIVIVLIGAPGSGKSTLAALLSPAFDRINQDALGCRSKCEDCAKAALQNGRSIVIDRCNFDAQQRSTWLSIARNFAARAVAVQLDVPLSVCTQRVAARRGHEGGVEGDSLAITDVVAKLHGDQRPVADDEGFDQVRVFQHTSTPENTAMELLSTFGMQSAGHSRVSTVPSSRPNPLPLRVPRVIGAQCDSSDSDSSQERRAIAFSLSSEHLSAAVPAATPAPAPASSHLQAFWSCQGCTFHNTDMERHNCSMCDSIRNTVAVPLPAAPAPASAPATAALMNKVGASDDDCILVQHDPPRSKRPLPGALAAVSQPIKVKKDPDTASAPDHESTQAPPSKKVRAKPVKTPAVPAPAQNQQRREAAAAPPPPPPPVPAHFQFTADTLLKAATLYLATRHLPASDNQQYQHAPSSNIQQSLPPVSHPRSQLQSQPQAEEVAVRTLSQSRAPPALASHCTAPQSQRFDFQSMYSQALESSASSSVVRSESLQPVSNGRPQLSDGNSKAAVLNDLTNITSDDFDTNWMNSLLPPPRSQVAAVGTTYHAPAPACDGGAVAGARWSYQLSGTSLKDIADKLCTSTPR